MLPAGCVIGHSEWAPTRKTDIGAYVNTVRAKSGSPVNATEGLFQTMTPAEEAEVLKAARQVNATIGSGQSSFEGTVEATLAGIQALFNLVNTKTGTLASNITDARTAILAGIAAMPTAGMTDEQKASLAEDIAARVSAQGVTLDADAVGQALGADLAGRLAS